MDDMKILHVVNSCGIGGIEWFVHDIVKEQLLQTGIQSDILFTKSDGDLKETFQELNNNLYFFDLKPFDTNFRVYKRINEICSNYDILHLHSYIPILDWCLFLGNNKIIFTNHSVYGYGRKQKLSTPLKLFSKKVFLSRKKIWLTFNSNYTLNFWAERGVRNINKYVIYNGVSFKTPSKSFNFPVENTEDTFFIGTTSRVIKWKRIEILINAFAEFLLIQSKNVHLVIVGDGSDIGRLKELVTEMRIEEKVTFIGNVKNPEDYQSRFHVCVFPSTTEAFGLVAIECMSFGKPVIVMEDGGGITEIVNEVEPENVVTDVPHMVERFNYYFHRREETNKQERIDYANSFDMKQMSIEFNKLYKRMILRN